MPVPIVSVAEMRAREEQTWASGVTPMSVIRRAGAAVAAVARRLTRPGDPVLVLAGRGHNGDDAAVAEEHLADRDTTLVRFGDTHRFETARLWLAENRSRARALIVDGMFGIGLNRPVDGDWAGLIETVNASGLRVLAVDVPSGLDADSGQPRGVAIQAAVTVTLGAVKSGLLRQEAAPFVGRLELAHDIGLVPPDAGENLWVLPGDFEGFPPRRRDDAHKGSHGHVAIVAGTPGYHGAAVLAARGALRARPGLVTVFVDERCYGPVASQLQAAMVRPWNGAPPLSEEFSSVVIGPGLVSPGVDPRVRQEIRRLWKEAPGAVVADASALEGLPWDLAANAGPRVITPHPGEAARLLETTTAAVQTDRFGTVRRLAELTSFPGLIVVLKGRHTVIGGRAGPMHVNSSGNPGLGQGGTGDVLAGYLGGWLAQPALAEDAGRTVRYGVWRHGAAADALESRGRAWVTEDLAEELGAPQG